MLEWIIGIVMALILIIFIIKIVTRKDNTENLGDTLSRIKRTMIDCCIKPFKK